MAYTKTPENSTYKTQRFNFVGSPQQRSGTSTKDQRFINLMPEVIKTDITQGKKYYLKKRPGVAYNATYGSGEGRGIWMFEGVLFVASGNQVYRNGVSIITWSSTITGRVGFTEGDTTTTRYLFITDGIEAYVVQDNGTTTKVTDADMPTPHLPYPVFVDGYIVLAKSGTADLYNCNLNDPVNWTAGDFVTAEMFPDDTIGITKHLNYIVAFGSTNTEFFYNAANASGTPFERNSGAVQLVGCSAPKSVVSTDNQTIFIGANKSGGNSVWMLEGFKLTELAIEPIKDMLDAETSGISNVSAFSIRTKGHRLYVINLPIGNRTIVYDIDEKLWHEWQYNGGVFPFNYLTDSSNGSPYALNNSGGQVFVVDDNTYVDGSYDMNWSVTTVKVDFDTYNRKFMHRFALIGDVPATAGSYTVTWSDDDYQTFSSGRTLTMTADTAFITQLGSFRRRAFRVSGAGDYDVRLEGFEVDINMGQQ